MESEEENCIFCRVGEIKAMTLMTRVWGTTPSKNIHEAFIWWLNCVSEADFAAPEERDGMLRHPLWGWSSSVPSGGKKKNAGWMLPTCMHEFSAQGNRQSVIIGGFRIWSHFTLRTEISPSLVCKVANPRNTHAQFVFIFQLHGTFCCVSVS